MRKICMPLVHDLVVMALPEEFISHRLVSTFEVWKAPALSDTARLCLGCAFEGGPQDFYQV